MNQSFNKLTFKALFLVAGLMTSQYSQASEIEMQWQKVDLKIELFYKLIRSGNCHKSQKQFLGCVVAAERVLDFCDKSEKIASGSRLNSKYMRKIIADFGPLKVVDWDIKSALQANSKMEFNKKRTSQMEADVVSLYETYIQEGKDVDFEEIIAWTASRCLNKSNESYATSQAFTGYYQITEDTHSQLVPKVFIEQKRATNTEKYSGKGFGVAANFNQLVIESVYPNSPAENAGLMQGDIVTAVNGERVTATNQDRFIQKMNGNKLALTVKRADKIVNIKMEAQVFDIRNVNYRMLRSSNTLIGQVKIEAFDNRKVCEDVERAVRILENEGAQGIILDLRNNPGGLVNMGICVTNVFIAKNLQVLEYRPIDAREELEIYSTLTEPATSLPLVVLVNGGSASASEIVSGILQEHERAIIVGEQTFGKGVIQSAKLWKHDFGSGYSYSNSSIEKLQTSAFYHILPSQRSLQGQGIKPDITAHRFPNMNPDEHYSFRETDLFNSPQPLTFVEWKPKNAFHIDSIAQCTTDFGRAKESFEKNQNSDYQLNVGRDVLGCIIEGIPGQYTASLSRFSKI